jgi:hypothetical protein
MSIRSYELSAALLQLSSACDNMTLSCALLLIISYVAAWRTQALAIERASPFGNAASVYTTSGANADYFAARFRAGMIGECICY